MLIAFLVISVRAIFPIFPSNVKLLATFITASATFAMEKDLLAAEMLSSPLAAPSKSNALFNSSRDLIPD